MIPISLIVTLEIIKGYFITNNIKLYNFVRKKYYSAYLVSIIEE